MPAALPLVPHFFPRPAVEAQDPEPKSGSEAQLVQGGLPGPGVWPRGFPGAAFPRGLSARLQGHLGLLRVKWGQGRDLPSFHLPSLLTLPSRTSSGPVAP